MKARGPGAQRRGGPGCGARSRRLALRLGRARRELGGKSAQPPAGSISPHPAHTPPEGSPDSGGPDWLGGAGERAEAGRERQSVRAPARRPGSVRPEDPGGSLGREAVTALPHPHLARGSLPRGPSGVHRLPRNPGHVCFVMGVESQVPSSQLGEGE